MSEMMSGWNNGKFPLANLVGGDRAKYRHEAELENLRHANAKDLQAHQTQLAHESRVSEMTLAHKHSTAQARQAHNNAKDFETHRATTFADMSARVGGGAPLKNFTVGDMSGTFGARPRAAAKKTPAAKKATPPKTAGSAKTTKAAAGSDDDSAAPTVAVKAPKAASAAGKSRTTKQKA